MRATKRGIVRQSRRLYRLCRIGGRLDESRVRVVVRRLLASRQRSVASILNHFYRLVRIDRNRHTALVESARSLPAEVRTQLERSLTARFDRNVRVEFTENAELIAGLRLRIGSMVYDDSVRGRLDAIGARL